MRGSMITCVSVSGFFFFEKMITLARKSWQDGAVGQTTESSCQTTRVWSQVPTKRKNNISTDCPGPPSMGHVCTCECECAKSLKWEARCDFLINKWSRAKREQFRKCVSSNNGGHNQLFSGVPQTQNSSPQTGPLSSLMSYCPARQGFCYREWLRDCHSLGWENKNVPWVQARPVNYWPCSSMSLPTWVCDWNVFYIKRWPPS